MNIYILTFIIALLYYLLAKKERTHSQILLCCYFLYLAVFIGLGDMIGGYDRYIYGEMFDTIADETSGEGKFARELYMVHGHEYGYFVWQVLCSYLTENRYIYILLSSLLMYALYFRAFKLYIKNYPLANIIFLGFFFYFTITYMRQVIACGFAWQGIQYVWQRKPLKFLFFALLAYSFHNSAIVFLLVYLLPIKKYSKAAIVVVMLFCVALGFTSLPTLMLSEAGGDRTGHYIDEMSGFRPEYIIEAVLFICVFFFSYKRIPNERRDLTFLNMSFLFCAILLVFMRFGEGGRFGWYFLMGIIYTLTVLSTGKEVFNRRMAAFTLSLSCALFLRVSYFWAFNLSPYKTFLTDGIPSGERWIYEQNEYNHAYTDDKFCRRAFRFMKKQ